jgi:hypothetical protein
MNSITKRISEVEFKQNFLLMIFLPNDKDPYSLRFI